MLSCMKKCASVPPSLVSFGQPLLGLVMQRSLKHCVTTIAKTEWDLERRRKGKQRWRKVCLIYYKLWRDQAACKAGLNRFESGGITLIITDTTKKINGHESDFNSSLVKLDGKRKHVVVYGGISTEHS